MVDALTCLLLAQDGIPGKDIIDAAASGNAIRMLTAVCVAFAIIIAIEGKLLVSLWNKRETDLGALETKLRAEWKVQADAWTVEKVDLVKRIDAMRDKHEADIKRLYDQMMAITERTLIAAERLANIDASDEGKPTGRRAS